LCPFHGTDRWTQVDHLQKIGQIKTKSAVIPGSGRVFGLTRAVVSDSEIMSGEDEKVKEEEEELDCSHPEVVNKYQFAGNVANGDL
jgi:hypothetical protein